MRASRLPRLLTAALLTVGLTVGCRPTDAAPPVPQPPAPEPITAPTTLNDLNVSLGQAASAPVNVPFGGQWSIPELPAWLSVSARAGKGAVAFTVTAQRAAATPLAAEQATLTDRFVVEWSAPDGSAGRSSVTVTADQYTVTGRVVDAPSVTGSDAGRASALNMNAPHSASRGVIVKYRSGLQTQSQQAQGTQNRGVQALARAGVQVRAQRDLGPRMTALDVADVPAALAALRADPNVEYAVPNAVLRAQQTGGLAAPVVPTDQYAALQWPFRLLGFPAVWRDMEGGAYTRPVTVAVVDSGVRFDHPDLAGQLWGPGEGALDVLSKPDNGDGDGVDPDPTDAQKPGSAAASHGTHVTGLIVARWGENAASCAGCSTTGVVGASSRAPVKVLPVRVLDAQGDAEVSDVIAAVHYAAGLTVTLEGRTYVNPHPAQVVNLSLGGPMSAEESRPLCDGIQEARNQGALIFAAAGNAGSDVPYYPAACPAAVAVGSVTLSGGSAPVRAPYSNAYPQVTLSAPGGADPFQPTTFNGGTLNGEPAPDMVFSTSWDYQKNQPNYYFMSGTSQATPLVSALAALVLSKGVTTGAADTLQRLTDTATDLGAAGRDEQFGWGMVNAAAALKAPDVSDTLGLRLQDALGHAFQPKVDALGRFSAWLGDGTYHLVAGRDRNGNGVYGETNEPRVERTFDLGPARTRVDLGDLAPR